MDTGWLLRVRHGRRRWSGTSRLTLSLSVSFVLTAGDSLLQIHSLETQQLYRVLKGHTAGVSHVAFSPSSPFLASASDDHTIRVWEFDGSSEDSYSGQHSARTLQGHSSAVICISWNPGGNLLASGGMDESVRVWDVQRGECGQSLERQIPRSETLLVNRGMFESIASALGSRECCRLQPRWNHHR